MFQGHNVKVNVTVRLCSLRVLLLGKSVEYIHGQLHELWTCYAEFFCGMELDFSN